MKVNTSEWPEYESNPFPLTPVTPRDYTVIMSPEEVPINYMAYATIYNVSSTALIRLLVTLAYHKLEGDNEVLIPIEIFQKVTGRTGRVSYYRAISELLSSNIIARKKYHKNVFYMNPEYIRSYNSK